MKKNGVTPPIYKGENKQMFVYSKTIAAIIIGLLMLWELREYMKTEKKDLRKIIISNPTGKKRIFDEWGYHFTLFISRFNISPDFVTLLMFFVSFLGIGLLIFQDYYFDLIGSGLLLFGYFLDYVDGQLARYYAYLGKREKSEKSHYIDLVGSWFVIVLLILVLGLRFNFMVGILTIIAYFVKELLPHYSEKGNKILRKSSQVSAYKRWRYIFLDRPYNLFFILCIFSIPVVFLYLSFINYNVLWMGKMINEVR